MTKAMVTAVAVVTLWVGAFGCGASDDENTALSVTWKFQSGDCASNKIERVRVKVKPPAPYTPIESDVACSAGTASLGNIVAGSYGFEAEGVDAPGTVRFTSTLTASFPDGKVVGPVDMTLRPKGSKVTVKWNGCPGSVILPYRVTLYTASTSGQAGAQAQQTQASCQASSASFDSVTPGSYIAEVDSRAVNPAVKGTKPVTVVAGEDVEVVIPVP